MAYGLTVLNNTTGVQIDGSSAQYALTSKGVISGIAAANPPQSWAVSYTTTTNPMMALRSTNSFCAVESCVKNGNTYTFTIFCVKATANASINWYVFDTPTLSARNSGYGLEVYNGSGQVIVSDLYPLLKIVGVHDGGYSTATRNYGDGRAYAQITNSGIYSNQVIEVGDSLSHQPDYIRTFRMGGWRWDSSGLSVDDNGSAQPHAYRAFDDYGGGPGVVLVADVTNL